MKKHQKVGKPAKKATEGQFTMEDLEAAFKEGCFSTMDFCAQPWVRGVGVDDVLARSWVLHRALTNRRGKIIRALALEQEALNPKLFIAAFHGAKVKLPPFPTEPYSQQNREMAYLAGLHAVLDVLREEWGWAGHLDSRMQWVVGRHVQKECEERLKYLRALDDEHRFQNSESHDSWCWRKERKRLLEDLKKKRQAA